MAHATALAPIPFDDHDCDAARALRKSIVAPAKRSIAARKKAAGKRSEDGLPIHSFPTLLADLATYTRNTMAPRQTLENTFFLYPELAPTQAKAFELLGIQPRM